MKKRLDEQAVRSKIGGIRILTSYESTFIAIYMILDTFSMGKHLASALYKEGEIQAKEPKENRIFLLTFHFIFSCFFLVLFLLLFINPNFYHAKKYPTKNAAFQAHL